MPITDINLVPVDPPKRKQPQKAQSIKKPRVQEEPKGAAPPTTTKENRPAPTAGDQGTAKKQKLEEKFEDQKSPMQKVSDIIFVMNRYTKAFCFFFRREN